MIPRRGRLTPQKARRAIPLVALAIALVLIGWYFHVLTGMWVAGFVVGLLLVLTLCLVTIAWKQHNTRE